LKASEPQITELPAIKQLVALLEKSFKTARTYGPHNPAAQRFLEQSYNELTANLELYGSIVFLVRRSELYYKGHSVYQTSSMENLAFKLHVDGIRELSFHKGLTRDDLSFFLEALWATYDQETSDEDIVTRLWEKNLATISCVTAEEIIKSSNFVDVLIPQNRRTLNSPVTQLRQVSLSETTRRTAEEGQAGVQPQFTLVGYEVTTQELDKLAKEIALESSKDSVTYLVDMLTAILASEQSEVLLSKLLNLFAEVIEPLIKDGRWKLLNTILPLLHEAQELCPNLTTAHRNQLSSLVDSLGRPDRLRMIEDLLNSTPDEPLDDLQALLLMLKSNAVQPLCELLGNLKHKSHRLMICEVLATLGKENTSQLVKGLTDPRWYYVRNLVLIIGKLNTPQLAKYLKPLVRHGDMRVRKEVLRTMRALCPGGRGDQFITFLNDHEESVRLLAMKILTPGRYTAPFSVWQPVTESKAFQDRSPSEKRIIFQIMCQMSGEDVIPYCRHLVTRWFWTNRRTHQEAGVLATEALKRIGTPAAVEALKAGKKRMNHAIRQACKEALAALSRQSCEQDV
jgi:HEAT repeat protein